MKIRRKKKKKPAKPDPDAMKVEVDVLVRFPDDPGTRVTHQAGAIMETNVKAALAEIYPGHNLRGLWVHEALPRGRDREKAVRLILESLEDEAEADPSCFVLRAQALARDLRDG